MAKKRRGRKMPAWRKTVKAAVGILGKVVGVSVAAGPLIGAVKRSMSVPEDIPKFILYDYTGVWLDTGVITWQKTISGIGSIVGGIALMKLFSYLARSV